MDIQEIRNPTDHEAALNRIAELMFAAIDTPEGDELERLTTLLEAYEEKQMPIKLADSA